MSGGRFTSMASAGGGGALTRNRLAAIGSDGSVLSWNPGADDTVASVALDSTWIYIIAGGVFKTVGAQTRDNYVTLAMDGVVK